jgi:hypothetical protein
MIADDQFPFTDKMDIRCRVLSSARALFMMTGIPGFSGRFPYSMLALSVQTDGFVSRIFCFIRFILSEMPGFVGVSIMIILR